MMLTRNGFHSDLRWVSELVMTSSPFALTRKKEYGNEPFDRYLEWFMPFCEEIKRVLKAAGSFVFDIGGAWVPA